MGADVEIALSGDGGSLTADRELIRATVLNLLLNAAQALAGTGGRIVVSTTTFDGSAVIDVRDNGPGIPAAIRTRVFEPFFTTKARGGGLGLAIAPRTAELHGGSLHLDCPPSGGTVVTLTVPIQPRHHTGSAG